ncbi:hypothetical protein BJ742DRAFT_851773 [Cladochytrium replicatum]|nr:hypothetical protein BJ742DRAFT_851773 [Cladochytrium replicatum]
MVKALCCLPLKPGALAIGYLLFLIEAAHAALPFLPLTSWGVKYDSVGAGLNVLPTWLKYASIGLFGALALVILAANISIHVSNVRMIRAVEGVYQFLLIVFFVDIIGNVYVLATNRSTLQKNCQDANAGAPNVSVGSASIDCTAMSTAVIVGLGIFWLMLLTFMSHFYSLLRAYGHQVERESTGRAGAVQYVGLHEVESGGKDYRNSKDGLVP